MRLDTEAEIDVTEIACRQVLTKDQPIFSIQWVVIPGTTPLRMTSSGLMEIYLRHIRRVTLTMVRPTYTENSLEFRLGKSSIPLIKFNLPVHDATVKGNRTSLCICGGFLVQPGECHRGQMDFTVEQVEDGTRLTLRLSDYCPLLLGSERPSLWRKWLYLLTQGYIHKILTVRFLAMVYRQLTGARPKTKVIKVAQLRGEK